MGYNTWFDGSFSFNKPVSEALKDYVNRFSNVRHMKRDVSKIKEKYPLYTNINLGIDGEYFEGGKENDGTIIDYNKPPSTQPGLWCQWIINNNDELVWDGNEKFYNYIKWLEYMINNFFEPFGYKLNGKVTWEGEDPDDIGMIIVKSNDVTIKYGHIIYSFDEPKGEVRCEYCGYLFNTDETTCSHCGAPR